jgi:hypothetical protein
MFVTTDILLPRSMRGEIDNRIQEYARLIRDGFAAQMGVNPESVTVTKSKYYYEPRIFGADSHLVSFKVTTS